MNDDNKLIEGLKQAWQMEVAGARTYRQLASREPNEEKQTILVLMAKAEDRHAARWASRLKELGASAPDFRVKPGERFRRWLLVQTGTDCAVRSIEVTEDFSDTIYQQLLDEASEQQDKTALKKVQLEEKAHGKLLGEMSLPNKPEGRLERILQGEKWHVRGSGWIGQAIYGMNDGLGAAFGLVSGVAGATSVNGEFVLLSGLAAAIASALSMGSGAYPLWRPRSSLAPWHILRSGHQRSLLPAGPGSRAAWK